MSGQVKLAGKSQDGQAANALQTTDYYYTVQGWLKAINNPNDTGNADNDGGLPDVFSMQLDYFSGDYENAGSGINPLPVADIDYSGNIQTQTWRQQTSESTSDYYGYQYNYDQRYQLKQATFGSISGGSFVKDDTYSVSQLDYDLNGNIKTLLRNGTPTPNDFTGTNQYKYWQKEGVEINQLEKVGTYASYEYNAIGQMVAQRAEAGSEALTQYLEYDVSGKAVGVYSYAEENAQGVWQYEEANLLHRYYYDDKGYRVRKEDVVNNKTTYYVRDASGSLLSTYERQSAGSEIALTEVPLYGGDRLGLAYRQTDGSLLYSYELKDHLGNVRSVITQSTTGQLGLDSWLAYYPFGKVNQALSSGKSSLTGRRYSYQGAFAEDEMEETGYVDFELRSFDPVIGRWISPDPRRQYASPYLAMGNNPVNRIDPGGGTDGPDKFKSGNCQCSYVDGSGNRITEVANRAEFSDMINIFSAEYGNLLSDRVTSGDLWKDFVFNEGAFLDNPFNDNAVVPDICIFRGNSASHFAPKGATFP